MWVIYAFISAFFAGLVAILIKMGLKETDSTLATALRTVVVVIFAWLMVFLTRKSDMGYEVDAKSFIFLILSGFATGLSWLCYFKALQLGDVNKVVPIDKSSVLLTMLLSALILHEKLSLPVVGAMILIAVGTYLMIERKSEEKNAKKGQAWLVFSILSALFAGLTSILAKIGITDVDSNLGTAIRTAVVLIMAWLMVFLLGKQRSIKAIDKKSWLYIILSGIATGLSWLFFFGALQKGKASVVVPIDKLSILISMGFSFFILKEKFSNKTFIGLVLIVVGTLSLLFF